MKSKNRATYILGLLALVGLPMHAGEDSPKAKAPNTPDPKPYPLGTCVVSGEKFGGDMGEAVLFVHEGREVKLCCGSCRKDFEATPGKFLQKIDAAAKKVKPYPLDTCLVSGEKLGEMGKPLVFVQDLQEIRLCCKSCKKDFDKAVKSHMAKLQKAAQEPKPAP
jgi:hypothetical protein